MNKEEKIHELTEIMSDWNDRKIDAGAAVYAIWKLFKKENMEAWLRRHPIIETNESQKSKEEKP